MWATLLLLAGGAYSAAALALARRDPELAWDWTRIELGQLRFPPDFVWGVATAAHQVEGGLHNNNWSRWETQRAPDGQPRIAGGQVAGQACDHWSRFREDIGLIQALGVDAYRLSVEWSRVEPEQGRYDEAALDRYQEIIEALRARGITPMVTLHHFTHPLWFEDLGSFEREENIAHFVRFCEHVFRRLGPLVPRWCTLNEPEVFATQGWFNGIFPPGKKDPQLTAVVLCNLVRAHGRVYRALKALPHGHDVEIGLVKDIFQFDPSRRWFLPDLLISRALDDVFNGSILAALETGHFRLKVPGLIELDAPCLEAAGTLDFVGLNYYSHLLVRFKPSPSQPFDFVTRRGDVQTDMPYPIYAEGFYRALKRIGGLRVPVYVTENGIADDRDDRRATFIRRYLYALSRARDEGVDIRGYYYWSLMDNFEWAEGWNMKFGLYAVDRETQTRTLRPGAAAFVEIVNRSHGRA